MASPTTKKIVNGGVVVVILSILAAIFMPVYSGDGRTRATACLSNMKQLGLGVLLYMSDADDNLPYGLTEPGPSAVGWAGRIYPYTKNPDIFRDPVEERVTLSYAMNANAVALPRAATHSTPDRSVLFFEIAGARRGRGESDRPPSASPPLEMVRRAASSIPPIRRSNPSSDLRPARWQTRDSIRRRNRARNSAGHVLPALRKRRWAGHARQ